MEKNGCAFRFRKDLSTWRGAVHNELGVIGQKQSRKSLQEESEGKYERKTMNQYFHMYWRRSQ